MHHFRFQLAFFFLEKLKRTQSRLFHSSSVWKDVTAKSVLLSFADDLHRLPSSDRGGQRSCSGIEFVSFWSTILREAKILNNPPHTISILKIREMLHIFFEAAILLLQLPQTVRYVEY